MNPIRVLTLVYSSFCAHCQLDKLLARNGLPGDVAGMGDSGARDWGERLRERAKELGISDSEVARRVGMTQRRYSSYVNMAREPNYEDLLRVCAVLGITPDHVLGVRPLEPREDVERRAVGALRRMPQKARELALAALEGMAESVRKKPR